jgi:hypothetical protein
MREASASDEELHELLRIAASLLGEVDTKPEDSDARLFDEIILKAEELRRQRKKKTAILSATRAGSIFLLVLAVGLLRNDLHLYLFVISVACIILGVSTFLERGD